MLLTALDAKSGAVSWKAVTGDYKRGESVSGAVLIVNGVVIIGVGGAEFGVRSDVRGYDLKSGRMLWRAHSIGPDDDILFDPEKTTHLGKPVGKDSSLKTWNGDQWKIGGGDAHGWYAYDPALDLLFYATGGPSTWNPAQRAGPTAR